jgi:hypothetical protein
LAPVLSQRVPFRLLDRLAAKTAWTRWPATSALLKRIAADGREGGWVIIGGLLWQQYARQPAEIMPMCRRYIIAADTWYGADILGERLPGPALVDDFEMALDLLVPWRKDDNRWVRRSLGVAIHFWAKRSRGELARLGQAQTLLDLLTPVFGERDMDAVKGLGWGVKTLGRHYPDEVAKWLMAQRDRPYRRLLLRKAMTYLPEAERRLLSEAYSL